MMILFGQMFSSKKKMFFIFAKESLSWWGHAHSLIAGIAIDKLSSKEKDLSKKFEALLVKGGVPFSLYD